MRETAQNAGVECALGWGVRLRSETGRQTLDKTSRPTGNGAKATGDRRQAITQHRLDRERVCKRDVANAVRIKCADVAIGFWEG